MNKEQNNQPNQEKNSKAEEMFFKTTISPYFLKIVGNEWVWDQLRTQAYAYFQNINWYVLEGKSEEKNDMITFTIKVTGEKGIWKETKDESEAENKSMWQKAKEKVGLSK